MANRLALKPRREPQQERSRQMRDDILEASIRVLASEDPLRFTTIRVAEVTGISVGSLYQYFPNKDALIYGLHTRMVAALWEEMQHILDHPRLNPRTNVRRIALMFFLDESDQMVKMGSVLANIDPFFDTLPEHQEIDAQVLARLTTFIGDVLPNVNRTGVAFGAQMLTTTIVSVGKSVAKRRLSSRDLRKWATATADMVCDHLGFP